MDEWGWQATNSDAEIWEKAYPFICKAEGDAHDLGIDARDEEEPIDSRYQAMLAEGVRKERERPLLTHGADVFETVYGDMVKETDPEKRTAIRRQMRFDDPENTGRA